MPGGCRLGDIARCPMDSHGCKVCTHNVQGPAVQGSNDVTINGKPALRLGDRGIHMLCCGTNTWSAAEGSSTVFINGKPAVRIGDRTAHCGGSGNMKAGSSNVIIGDGQGRLFSDASKSHAPFVQNIAADKKRDHEIWQQNMEYLKEKGVSGDLGNSELPENFVKRTKHKLKNYLDDRGTQKYGEGHYVAAYIDAMGSSMLDDVPETAPGAAVAIGTDIVVGKSFRILGKGGKLLWSKAGDFIGKLRGKKILLKGVKGKTISYTKRTLKETAELRKQFQSTEKKKFLKSLTDNPEKIDKLKKAGLRDTEIAKMKDGLNPSKEWQVHHKLPLDDGGTNDMDNLILIKNDPYHKTITNAQNSMVSNLSPGQTVEMDWPIPEGSIYPPGN